MAFIKETIILLLLLCFQLSFSQNDCTSAIVSCGNTSFNNLSVQGAGIEEINSLNSCGGQEINSLWIKVTIKVGGTLGFIITPVDTNINVDFDFYVFGPDVTCGNLGSSIRCSTTNPAASGAPNNLTGMTETETDVFEGPGDLGSNYVHWLEVSADETYYIAIDRAVGNGDFSLQWTGTATFSDPPVINDSATGNLNLKQCDSDAVADDSTEFDLTQNQTIAIGTQTNLIAAYFVTESDATVGANAITTPTAFRNTTNPQTVYIRLENTISSCFEVTSFTLTVAPFNLPDLIDLKECDQDNDGFVVFNLSQISNLLNADPNNAISFHHTNNDNINLPVNYTNQTAYTNEVLWVKVYNSVTGCTAYKSFNLIINSTPPVVSSQITQCDFELFPDGKTTFNLTQANPELTSGDNTLVTKFYLNATDASNDQNELNTTYNNISNPQTLTVKVINPSTGCYSFTQLILNVNVNPTATVTLQNCDDSIEDGITTFNLADAGFVTIGNIVGYYYNINDALLEQNPITTDQFSSQDIYARIENANDCVGINVIKLIVLDLPQVTIDLTGFLCTNDPKHLVNLNTNVSSPGNYSYSWTPNGETTQNIIVSQPADYTVTVTNTLTTCHKDATIQVDSSEAPIINPFEVVDLVQVNSVTALVSGNGDYWYSLDDGIYQQSNFFENVIYGQHFVTIQDRNGCGSVVQKVYVLGVPSYFTPNGDGYQDYWQIKGIDGIKNGKSKVQIFNRFGKLLKQISPLSEGWDGTFSDHSLPGDDYWYSIQFQDGRSIKGHFAIKR